MRSIIATLFLCVTAHFIIACDPIKPAHVVVVLDQSESMTRTRPAALGVSEASIRLPGIRKNSTIAFMVTGTVRTSSETVLLGVLPIVKGRKAMEGPIRANDNAEFIGRVEQLLNGLANDAPISPVALAIMRAIQYLRGQGCGADPAIASCYLTIISDGEETEEQSIVKALHGKGDFKPPENLVIDNTGIEVRFCGISDTTNIVPERNSATATRLEQVWKSIFKEPGSVFFDPFCPQSRAMEENNESP